MNHEILRWARESAALSIEEAAKKIHLGEARGVSGPDRRAALEAGSTAPASGGAAPHETCTPAAPAASAQGGPIAGRLDLCGAERAASAVVP